MKSIIVLYAITLCVITSISAQNVGIGETAPANKLAVKGSLSVGSTYSTTAAPTDGAIILGNVGIGTASPGAGYKLDVNGVVNAASGYTVGGTTAAAGNYLRGNGTNFVSSTIQAADIPTLNQNTTGSAGSFTGSLTGDVTGTQSATYLSKIQGTSINLSSLASGNMLQYNGTNWVNVTPASTAVNIYNTDGTLTGNRTLTMGADYLYLNTSGGNLILGTGEASGAPAGGILRGPNAGSGNASGGNLTLNAGYAYGAGAGGSVFINGGTSGSGTNGNIYLRGGYSSGAEGAVYLNDDHTGQTFINDGGGIVTIGSGTAGTSEVNITNGLVIDKATANTGSISNSNVATGNGITFGGSSGEGIASNRANSATNQNQYGIDLYTNFTRRLSVGNTGLIGIGTAGNITPAQQLTVLCAGGVYTNAEAAISGISTLTGTTTSDYILYMGADKTNALSYIQSVHYGTAVANLGLNARGGNVGVGTASPAKALHVIATSNTDGILIQNTAGGSGSQANLYFETYSGETIAGADIAGIDDGNYSAHLAFSTRVPGSGSNSLSERMRLTSAGYLGIGTTSPTSTLDVRGNVNLNQNELYISGNNDNNHHIKYNSNYDGPEIAGCGGMSFISPCYSGTPLAVLTNSGSAGSWSYSVANAYGYMSAGEYYSYRYNKYLDVVNDLDSIDHIRPMRMMQDGKPTIVNDISTYPSSVIVKTKEGVYGTCVGDLSGLNTGAIRELRAETRSRDRMLEDRIDRLENLVSQLTGAKLGEMEYTASSVAYKDVDSYFIVDARIKPTSVISISGLSDYTIVNQSEGGFGIRFGSAPSSDIKFTYSSRY